MNNKYCVYLHRRKDNNEIFYVGQGTLTRPYIKTTRSVSWNNIANSGFVVEIVFSGLTKEDALKIESELILKHRDTIVNSTRQIRDKKSISDISCLFVIDNNSPSGLSWKVQPKYSKRVFAGNKTKLGYFVVGCYGNNYKAHRIVYTLAYGVFDDDLVIDHIDRNPSNNSPCNLRAVTWQENSRNRQKTNRKNTGVVGVSYRIATDSYLAHITIDGVSLTASFSCKKYTKDTAFSLAKEWRKQKELYYGFN